MRVVFLQPFFQNEPYQNSMPPLGVGYLSSYAKERCWFVETFFAQTPQDAIDLTPDLVGLSSATENFNDAIKTAEAIKKTLNIPIVIGGIHITSLPHTLPDCFDVGVIGEGEETFTEVAKIFNENVPSIDDLLKIRGICFHKDGEVIITQPREFFKSLDALSYPDRKILGEKWAIPFHKQVHMITSRGCPYNCTFCASSLHWGRFRTFSAKYVVDEIEFLIEKYEPLEVYFFDDLFIGHLPRFKEICNLLEERGLHKNVIFRSYARVDLLNENFADTFANMNFRYIDFGFESNSEKVLKFYNKSNVTPEKNQRAIDLLFERGISIGANFLLGAPIETYEEMQCSLDFCIKNKDKLDRLSVGPVLPLPGTPLWFQAIKDGIVSESMDWSAFHLDLNNLDLDKIPYLCKNVSKEKFMEIQNQFNQLAKEINQAGYIRKLNSELARREAEVFQLKSEVATIKGSSLFKIAWKLRNLFHKTGKINKSKK